MPFILKFYGFYYLNYRKAQIICTSCFTGTKDDELDSDDFDDEDDDDDDENEEVQNGGSQEQAGSEALGNLKKYMEEMDQELQSTNIGKSFTQNNGVSIHRCYLSFSHNVVKAFDFIFIFLLPYRPVIKQMHLKAHRQPRAQSLLRKKSSRLMWISTWLQIYLNLSLLRRALLGLRLTYCRV